MEREPASTDAMGNGGGPVRNGDEESVRNGATESARNGAPGRGFDTLPTGIDSLDRILGGGIPRGSLVTFAAQPVSQSEMLLTELVRARPTVYVTTLRPEETVRDSLERSGVQTDRVSIYALGPAAPGEGTDETDAMIWKARHIVAGIPPGTTVIVDPIDVFEWAPTDDYLGFLNEFHATLAETGSIGIAHCLAGRAISDNRDVTDYVSDIAFHLSTTITDDGIDTRLAVPKFRGRSALQETIKLDLTEEITVDMSRNIA